MLLMLIQRRYGLISRLLDDVAATCHAVTRYVTLRFSLFPLRMPRYATLLDAT